MPSRLGAFAKLIRLEHTLFALPYVYMGLLFAPGPLTWSAVLLATGCAVTARTSAMILNRIVDREIDRKNPRTRDRAGLMREVGGGSLAAALCGSVAGLALFTFLLSPILLFLVPVAVGLFIVYPYAKRFTAGSHFLLGLSLSVAPIGGFLAGLREFPFPLASGIAMVPLSLAVLFWVAGFDVIYSLDDLEFDLKARLRSIPAAFGYRGAQIAILAFYALAVAMLFAILLVSPLVGWAWLAACVVAVGVLAWQLAAVARSRKDAGKRRAAFNANLALSPLLLAALSADVFLM